MKRAFDIVVSAAALLAMWPLMLFTALLVRINLGSPVLFRQRRPGLHGVEFSVLKFRTMIDMFDQAGNPLPDRDRLTRFGLILRSTSLDELPQLINVLRGDMSLVGPRPLLAEYLPMYSARQAIRHNVRPGITGWAQVNGRNSLSWDDRLELDAWYVENRTMLLDIRILAMTVRKVLYRSGVSQDGNVTMEKFSGSSKDPTMKNGGR